MRLQVNGEWKDTKAEYLKDFLLENQYEEVRIAAEVNGRIVPRAGYQTQELHENDVLEIVTFVGGG